MGDLDINKVLRSGIKSHNRLYKKYIYWLCKHYFYCDIHPNDNIDQSVRIAHNGLGIVINEEAVIDQNVEIQHHVTIGSNGKGVPHIEEGVRIGAYAIIIGASCIIKNTEDPKKEG